MKTLMTLLAAGAMLASAAQALGTDPTVEERFRAKYGRYSLAEEVRRKAIAEAKHHRMVCDGESCCHHDGARTAAPAQDNRWSKDYLGAQLGRTAEATNFGTTLAGRVVHKSDTAQRLHAKLGIAPANLATDSRRPKTTELRATAQLMCDLPCCNR